jgi:hypothetical protein
MTVSPHCSGHVLPAVSLQPELRDTSSRPPSRIPAILEVVAAQSVSPTLRGHIGTHAAMPAPQRVPGGGSYKRPPRDVGRAAVSVSKPNEVQRP